MKVGIWLRRDRIQSGIVERDYKCSECGWNSGHVQSDWKACPKCTARMFFSMEELRNYVRENENGKAIRI